MWVKVWGTGKQLGKLTALQVKAAIKPGTYQDGDGLMLVVRSAQSRSWLLRMQVDGKRRDFGLGSAKSVNLAEARAAAVKTRALFSSGVDPVAKKRADSVARAAIPTFQEAAISVHAEQKDSWKNVKHRADWLSSLERYAYSFMGKVRVHAIDAPMVRECLLPIWLSKPETARRVRQRIKTVLDWAAAKGFRAPLDISGVNKGLPRQPATDNHFAALDFDKVPAFVAQVRSAPETVGRLALIFTILTAARSGEVRGAIWQEIDMDAKTWSIPAIRMKAGKAHVVPLSEGAVTILKRIAKLRSGDAADPIFPGTRGPLSDMTLSKIVRDMGVPVTVHGFRSAFKDWASETTAFPDAVSEAALAHKDANSVRAAYRRTDFFKLRVELMDAWSAYINAASASDE